MKATPELKKLVEQSIKYASQKDALTVWWWGIFKPKKCKLFIEALERGMHWSAAVNTAKESKIN